NVCDTIALIAENISPMTGNKTTQAARVAGKNGFSLISDGTFRELYAALLQCKMLDERLQTTDGYEGWAGREASTAGVITCLQSGDSVTPTPRGQLANYLQNASLTPRRAASSAMTHLAIATGDALRHKLEGLGNIAVVFANTSACNLARDAFAAATEFCLPVLYVLEGSAPAAEICGDIPVIRVDGSDAIAVYRVAHESIARARDGGGPTVMECAAWPGDSQLQDPLAKLEHYLAGKKLFRQDWKQRLEKKYSEALDEAAKTAGFELIRSKPVTFCDERGNRSKCAPA
ncbi:MAG: thiamine pyrophosphate-dependent enzyme, partial [Silvibacterium sp.]